MEINHPVWFGHYLRLTVKTSLRLITPVFGHIQLSLRRRIILDDSRGYVIVSSWGYEKTSP
ncbi:MAG: hypothetical protein QXZ44_01080 [Ferroplasma sp.]